MKWKFYYDESFHDRSITVKDDNINIYKDNAADVFVGFFTGYMESDEEIIWNQYKIFDENYRKEFTIEDGKELKGKTIKRKNYRNGFASFFPKTIDFYNDFFDILNNDKVVFHIGMFSKTEVVVREFIRNLQFPEYINFHEDSFIYSVVKFLYNYRNKEFLIKMMEIKSTDNAQNVLFELKKMMFDVISNIGDAKRKQAEKQGLNEVLCLLNYAKIKEFIPPELSWRYEPIFIGFNKLLKERKIKQEEVDLFIDEEKNTFEAAINIGNYRKCECVKSEVNIGIRISDILSHFFGEISAGLESELREPEIINEHDIIGYDYKSKKLLSEKWFEISERQYLLWRKIGMLFSDYQRYEWTGYDGVFCDYPVLAFGLLEYICHYDTYEAYKKIPSAMHREYFNTYCCVKLSELYKRGGSKPAIYN